MQVYNCRRIDETRYRITRFDGDFIPFEHDGRISSYTCTSSECNCPQERKPSCRHRKMLPFFIDAGHIDDNFFFEWDTHLWHKATGVFEEVVQEKEPEPTIEERLTGDKRVEQAPEPVPHTAAAPVSSAPSPRPSTFRRMR